MLHLPKVCWGGAGCTVIFALQLSGFPFTSAMPGPTLPFEAKPSVVVRSNGGINVALNWHEMLTSVMTVVASDARIMN